MIQKNSEKGNPNILEVEHLESSQEAWTFSPTRSLNLTEGRGGTHRYKLVKWHLTTKLSWQLSSVSRLTGQQCSSRRQAGLLGQMITWVHAIIIRLILINPLPLEQTLEFNSWERKHPPAGKLDPHGLKCPSHSTALCDPVLCRGADHLSNSTDLSLPTSCLQPLRMSLRPSNKTPKSYPALWDLIPAILVLSH